jgi:hypothetical protein
MGRLDEWQSFPTVVAQTLKLAGAENAVLLVAANDACRELMVDSATLSTCCPSIAGS